MLKKYVTMIKNGVNNGNGEIDVVEIYGDEEFPIKLKY